ncbi:unnamed protein product [Diamesa hyperborea]
MTKCSINLLILLVLNVQVFQSKVDSASTDNTTLEFKLTCYQTHNIYHKCVGKNLLITNKDIALNHTITIQIDKDHNITTTYIDVEIEDSQMYFIPMELFQNIPNLKNLVIRNASIEVIYPNTFSAAFHLYYLTLSHNNISFLPEDAFKNASDLQSIKLDNNQLISLSENIFKSLSNLRVLELSHNKIKNLPYNVFHDLTSLEFLYLAFNEISVLSLYQFELTTQLYTIDLSNNHITLIDEGTFDNLRNLHQLNLAFNLCVNDIFNTPIHTLNDKLCTCKADNVELCPTKHESNETPINNYLVLCFAT